MTVLKIKPNHRDFLPPKVEEKKRDYQPKSDLKIGWYPFWPNATARLNIEDRYGREFSQTTQETARALYTGPCSLLDDTFFSLALSLLPLLQLVLSSGTILIKI